MAKVLTVPDTTPAFSLTPKFGTTEVQVEPVTASTGAVSPIAQAVVVDPNRVGPPPVGDGSWDGANTFKNIQAAFDSLPADAVATIWLVPSDNSAGSLTTPTGYAGRLTVRAMGDKETAQSLITSVTMGNGTSSLSLHNVIVSGDIVEEGGEGGQWNGTLALHASEAQGAITCPAAQLYTFDYSAINGPGQTNVNQWFSRGLRNGSPDVVLTNSLLQWDDVSEQVYFDSIGTTTLASGVQIFREDDAACDGTVGADSAQTWTSDVTDLLRAICVPGRLSANRIWKLVHSTDAATGFYVDVWTQTADLTITDNADATLVTVPAGSRPQRLVFFAVGPTEFELVGMQPFNTGTPS